MSIMITPARPDSPDAVALINELDTYLMPQYPSESRHGYSVEKLITQRVAFFIVHCDGAAAGCGGVQLFGAEYAELKRMFVRPQYRGLGLGRLLIAHLERYTADQGVPILRLETGIHQHEAIRLYERTGFQRIAPFGPYRNDPLSLCYEKRIDTPAAA